MRIHLLLSLAIAALSATTAAAQGLTTRAAEPADVATLDGIMAAFYDIVSHDAGEPVDWARDSTLYLEHVRFRIAQSTPAGMRVRNVDHAEFAALFADASEAFYEREIHRVTHRFGPIAQVWSTYEWRTTPDGPVGGRGINAIDLYFDGTRWWIGTASWTSETPANPIPAEYLPGGPTPARAGEPIQTDRLEYTATRLEGNGSDAQYGFTVGVEYRNPTEAKLWLARCRPDSDAPQFRVEALDADQSAYSHDWACVGHGQHLAVAPGETRTFVLQLRGPNAWGGCTAGGCRADDEHHGQLEGRIRVFFDVYRCGGECSDRAPRQLGISNQFVVSLE